MRRWRWRWSPRRLRPRRRTAGTSSTWAAGPATTPLKLLEFLPNLDATLIDLSQPMLDRVRERVSRATTGRITTIQADIREARLPDGEFDIVLAAAVLNYLRADEEWLDVLTALHWALRPGGSVWVFDLVESSIQRSGG